MTSMNTDQTREIKAAPILKLRDRSRKAKKGLLMPANGLLKDHMFEPWKHNGENSFWICGCPSKGKTHLSEFLVLVDKFIQSLREHREPPVLKCQCDTRNIRLSTGLAMVLSLLNKMLALKN